MRLRDLILESGSEPWMLYHGTQTAIRQFDNATPVYLTFKADEAAGFAAGKHRPFSTRTGAARVLRILARPGPILDIEDDAFFEELEDGDIDALIDRRAAEARRSGDRYLEFTHPSFSGDDNYRVLISLFAGDDLRIQDRR